jgi:hypothetical protein
MDGRLPGDDGGAGHDWQLLLEAGVIKRTMLEMHATPNIHAERRVAWELGPLEARV